VADKLNYSDKEIAALIESVYEGTVTPFEIPESLYLAIGDYLKQSLYKGFGGTLADFEGTPLELLTELRSNIYFFSAAKTFQQTLEMSEAITNADGEILPFSKFKQAAADIYAKYNGGAYLQDDEKAGYLQTEYDTAFAQAQNVVNWEKIESEKELFPYLRKNVVEDNNTCEICAPLDGMIAPVDDPVWDTLAGSLHFSCRCFEEQVTEEKGYLGYDKKEVESLQKSQNDLMDDMFKFNAYKQKEIFSPEHPYFSVPKQFEKEARDNFGMPIPETDE